MTANPANAQGAALHAAERITRSHARRIAAALGLDPSCVDTLQTLPPGWHWAFCLATPARAGLAQDGLPADDPLLAPLDGFARRVMGSTTFEVLHPIPMEAELACASRMVGITDKTGRSGAMRILTLERLYSVDDRVAVSERQEVLYLPSSPSQEAPVLSRSVRAGGAQAGYLSIDEIDVFRFSAVTFNSHRIHYDAPYAQQTEHWPGLVVQAKLLALHLLIACERLQGPPIRRFTFRSVAPLFCPAQVRLALERQPDASVTAAVHSAEGLHLSARIWYD